MYNKLYSVVEHTMNEYGKHTTVLMNTDDFVAAERFMREYGRDILSVGRYKNIPGDINADEKELIHDKYLSMKYGRIVKMSESVTNHQNCRRVILFERNEEDVMDQNVPPTTPVEIDKGMVIKKIEHYIFVLNDLSQLTYWITDSENYVDIRISYPPHDWIINFSVGYDKAEDIVRSFARQCLMLVSDESTEYEHVSDELINVTKAIAHATLDYLEA